MTFATAIDKAIQFHGSPAKSIRTIVLDRTRGRVEQLSVNGDMLQGVSNDPNPRNLRSPLARGIREAKAMTAIGGKTKIKKPTQPQYVVQISEQANDYALFKADDHGNMLISWVGDPNAATKFDSKYQAKARIRELADIPDTRCFKQLD